MSYCEWREQFIAVDDDAFATQAFVGLDASLQLDASPAAETGATLDLP